MKLLSPDVRVMKLAKPIRELGELTRRSEPAIRRQIGKWESDVEAFNLILLAATQAIAVCTLARSSISFLPAISTLARASMEAGARSMWLLAPDDQYEREGRWLAHLETELSARKRVEMALDEDSAISSTIQDFGAAFREKLPPGTFVPARIPKFDRLLEAVGTPKKYLLYTMFSQATHATHHGTGNFRRNLGNCKSFGDFASAREWFLPLSSLWWFLARPLLTFSSRCAITDPDLCPVPLQERFVTAQQGFRMDDR
jgi:hypothetical protein